MAPDHIQTYGNRPSRLLNLNKSPTENKKIAATNAARSPFLLLPPEVRGRIYDYAFGGNVVHITKALGHSGKLGYRVHICHCAQDHGPPQKLIRLPPLEAANSQAQLEVHTQHDDCVYGNTRKPLTRWFMPLSFLQVCRQIYHEAALKPFSQTIFDAQELHYYGLQAFLCALVPTQARAIKNLQVLCTNGKYHGFKIMKHFKGLEILGIQLVNAFKTRACRGHDEASYLIESSKKGLSEVKNFSLKKFHISILVDEEITTAEEESLADLLEQTERSLQQSAA